MYWSTRLNISLISGQQQMIVVDNKFFAKNAPKIVKCITNLNILMYDFLLLMI